MIDQKTATKRAYDLAAERLCEHVYICPDCSLGRGRICDVGQPLLLAENEAWAAHMETRQ